MAVPVFWWLDDSDAAAARGKLAAVRQNQFSEWEWIRFVDDAYQNADEAMKSLITSLGTGSMFSGGKVIYCYGVPFEECYRLKPKEISAYHAKIADEIGKIPEGVIFIIISKLTKTSTIYKKAAIMETAKRAKITASDEISKENAIAWIQERAAVYDLSISKDACMMLADLTALNRTRICNEIDKLRHVAVGNKITEAMIEQYATGDGEADVRQMCLSITGGHGDAAHEYLQRLLDRGEPPLKICGYLMDWARKMSIAMSSGLNYDSVRSMLPNIKKFDKASGKTVPMFANPGTIFHACNELQGAGKQPNWVYQRVLLNLGELQLRLRERRCDEVRLMHEYVQNLV